MIMKKLDLHCHVSGPCEPDSTLFLSPEEALEMFEEKNVACGVILPMVDYGSTMSVQRIEDVAEIVKKYPGKFYFFMNLCPHSFSVNPEADYSDLIEYYLAMGAKGVGEMSANRTFLDVSFLNIITSKDPKH